MSCELVGIEIWEVSDLLCVMAVGEWSFGDEFGGCHAPDSSVLVEEACSGLSTGVAVAECSAIDAADRAVIEL